MKFRNKKKSGFTLLEMLVVIAIAAMILSFIFVSIRSAKQKSRDSKRESDAKQLQSILSIYANDRGLYPTCAAETIINGSTDCLSTELVSSGAMQSNRLSTDPLQTGTCGGSNSYVYCYQSANGSTYTIRYSLETNTVPGKSAGWQTVNP